MNDVFDTLLWRQLWQITLLIPAAIFFVRYALPRAPHVAYGILLLVLVKAIFPPVWDSPTGVLWEMVPIVGQSKPAVTATDNPIEQEATGNFRKSSSPSGSTPASSKNKPQLKATQKGAKPLASAWSWGRIGFGIWLAGVLCLLGYILGKRAQLLRFHRDTQVPASDELLEAVELVSADLGLLHIPKVLVTLHPTVPFASGFFNQVVVLPAHVVEKTDLSELKLILAHEMTHLRRGDTLIGILQLVAQVLWWFHPLVYWLNREVRRIREECCDTDVVSQLRCQPASYARCLLNMLELHQKLRPSKELVGLSPLEVTTKRMQNIMRTTKQKPDRLSRTVYAFSLILFAFIVLPTSASSTVTPKVIVGDIEPQGAKRIVNAPKHNPPKKKPTPPELPDILPQPGEKVPEGLDPVEPTVPELPIQKVEYKFVRGDKHPYKVHLEAKYPTELRTHSGSPTFRVDAYAEGIPAFTRFNIKFTNQTVPREGVTIPTLPSDVAPEDDDYPFRFSPPAFGPPFSRFSDETSVDPVSGSNGSIDPSKGNLPYLLGSLKSWVFPQLPPDLIHNWQEDYERDLTLIASTTDMTSPFTSPHQEKLHATVETHVSTNAVSENEVSFIRVWKLSTSELANDEPRREISLVGKLLFDVNKGILTSSVYEGKLVERETNREYRIPLKLNIQRLE